MSDTYEKVMTNIVENDARQQNSMIIMRESGMIWKRLWCFKKKNVCETHKN